MNTKKIFTAIICGLSFFVNSQSYELSTSTAAYINLTSSTSLNNTAPWDDPEFAIPIGFDFEYFDITINQIYIDDWGFGAGLTTNPNETGTLPVLIPYGADIADRGYDFNNENATTGSLSNISYLVEGSVGNRILKIEWNNVGFHSDIFVDGISTDFTNFQMWLFEGSNDIEIHFGPNSISNPDESFDGEAGSLIALIPSYNFGTEVLEENATFLSGNPINPTVILSTVDDNTFLDGVIPNGTIYKFTRSTLSTEEFRSVTKLELFPNPSNDVISISGITTNEKYEIYNLLGNKIEDGIIYKNKRINIQNYSKGIYLIKLDNNQTLKFIKS
ncbi:T9SS type A sorting domain-containing protein [uncultured Aquimarina sp.]|uniref:T9SS type A sorting domain-containing protein n=1 Tax=uncultured Aquimarina sp. TaxID=575652 RepID=UPI002601E8AA|nr:T9SS type A sorting domain-containing protein [uncultured Aquimarina sp.]